MHAPSFQQTLRPTTLLRMTRPGFLSITAVACLIGIAACHASGTAVNLAAAALTLLMATMAHAAANVLNDYHDALNGADAANTQGLFPFSGGSRMIQTGVVTIHQTRRWGWTLMALLLPGGLWLTYQSGSGLLLIGLVGLFLGWAYSAPPCALMSRGLGELTVALVWWLIVQGAFYVQHPDWVVLPMVLAISYGLLIANILLINGFPDAAADQRVGKRTLVVQCGPRLAAMLYWTFAVLAYGWLGWNLWLKALPPGAEWGWLSVPLSVASGVVLWQRADRPQTLRPAIGLTIAAATVHGLGLTAGLILFH